MRRVLLTLLCAAAPAVTLAQTTDANGTLTFTPDPLINQEECADTTATVDLSWTAVLDPGVVFGGGVYRIFASNRAPPTTGDRAGYCFTSDAEASATAAGGRAGPVGQEIPVPTGATAPTQTELGVPIRQIVQAAGFEACDATTDQVVYVCVHWYQRSPTPGEYRTAALGRAKGTMTLSFAQPPAPVITSVTRGDGALNVSWSEGEGTPDAVRFEIVVTSVSDEDPNTPDDPVPSRTVSATTSPRRVSGLVPGATYSVVVYGFSEAGTRSEPSAAVTQQVSEVEDFWEWYQGREDAREEGGCASGPAGLLGLLGAASALALRRIRRKS